MPLQPSRTIDELRELRELTGDENGAQRVAWTETWERAREWAQAALDIAEDIDHGGWKAVALWELAEIDAGRLALSAARKQCEAALTGAL